MKWFGNLKIRMKMLFSFALVVVIVAFISVFAILQMQNVDKTYSYAISYPLTGQTTMLELQSSFIDMRRGATSIVMYAPKQDIEKIDAQYDAVGASYDSAIAALGNYISNVRSNPNYSDADKQTRVDRAEAIKDLVTQYHETILKPSAKAAREGDYETALSIAITAGSATSEIMGHISDLVSTARETSETAVTGATHTASATTATLIIIAVAAVLISVALAFIVASVISKPLVRLLGVATNVAGGNLNVNIDASSKDEAGMLAKSFVDVIGVVHKLIESIDDMSRAIDTDGDIDARVDSSQFSGAYVTVADNINKALDGVIEDTLMVLSYIDNCGKGNFDASIKQMPGKKILLNNAVNQMSDNLKSISGEINALVRNALGGNLKIKADAAKYQGDWADIVSGLNSLMDAVDAPTSEVSSIMRHLARGRFDKKMQGDYKGDFLAMKEAINTTVTNIASYIDEIARTLTGLSQNDLNQAISREYAGDFAAIKNAMNNIITTFNSVIGDISVAAEQVSAGAKSISESSMTLAQGATEQASSVQELNATVLTINESTTRNAENAKNAQTLSDGSKGNASKGDNDMASMLNSMGGIKESSNKISKIIKVIEDIAFQTNLLALNAAVEAARAGEHGKGFAVVAEEVRTLASRSQTAAKETAALIEESIIKVDEGTQTADKTADALKTIVNDIDKIAEIITDIANASENQAEAVAQVVQGLNQITSVVQNNSATSEETASASQQLSGQADIMRNLVSVFKMKA